MVKARRMLATTSELYEWLCEKYREADKAMKDAISKGLDSSAEQASATAYLCAMSFSFGYGEAVALAREAVLDAEKELMS